MDKLEFPVATCPFCNVRGPVIIERSEIFFDESGDPLHGDIIVCPECVKIINNTMDIEVEWFDFEDAKYFGWKVVADDGQG